VFTILHTNDFHNRLNQPQIARLQELRRDLGSHGLLLDAGDAVGSGNITFRPGGEPILEQMTAIGYDAMTVGNREFHFSKLGFETKLGRARFPVLCGNIRLTQGSHRHSVGISAHHDGPDPGPVPPVQSYLCREIAGAFHVVVFGLTVPMITERMTSRHVSPYVFDDPIKVGMRLAAQLRVELRPDLLIALTHIGIARDRELAAASPEIDLIIGGHTHVVLEHGERVAETLIVQAGSHGRYVGRVEVTVPGGAGGGPELRATLEPLC
jgi:2',3'-cyclic-nucleotide 2'-phosphodiesterase (5'-nucleotidase family)